MIKKIIFIFVFIIFAAALVAVFAVHREAYIISIPVEESGIENVVVLQGMRKPEIA